MRKSTLMILSAVFLIGACASMTKHFTKTGEFVFDGGVYKSKSWSDDLIFKRVTWFREVTTVYDIGYWKVDATSPYFAWFSGMEKARIRNHKECYILLAYQEDPKKISNSMLIEQLRNSGLEKVNISTFASFIKMHPQAGQHSVHRYNVYGMCSKEKVEKGIDINFPGFATKTLTY